MGFVLMGSRARVEDVVGGDPSGKGNGGVNWLA